MNKVNSTKNRIFLLIGFMACGKSFYGEKCAKYFNYDFIDLDKYIENKESKTIKEIFENKGEEYFRNLETKIFSEILLKHSLKIEENRINNKKTIISVGGGFPLKEKNQKLMKEVTTIFVDTDLKDILSRLNSEELTKRPLLKSLNTEEIEKLYEKRYKIYKNIADFSAHNYNEIIKQICINNQKV